MGATAVQRLWDSISGRRSLDCSVMGRRLDIWHLAGGVLVGYEGGLRPGSLPGRLASLRAEKGVPDLAEIFVLLTGRSSIDIVIYPSNLRV